MFLLKKRHLELFSCKFEVEGVSRPNCVLVPARPLNMVRKLKPQQMLFRI